MQIFFGLIFCFFFVSITDAAQICKPDSILASTPDSQLVDNNDGTITDIKTGLMWKRCLEGVEGDNCENGSPSDFTWQQALQQPRAVNDASGFAGYGDWRLPNIRELITIVEEQCYNPAINLNRFPNTPSSYVWSGSPHTEDSYSGWDVYFLAGQSSYYNRRYRSYAVRLVRGG
ncbi:hypothetical protein H206_01435 [Candidatus Electrothrix aarhusensis]|uniref:Lcl C-terminal domain-containing protein n=1 Tax=Candidatus Electrothrix aarhusensis TaxID=1859131 RepID=A0A3S3QYG2_9BACT|nr:hypothetical protein H206_01435 [Candidatus Electrothrix aarhusensis]